MRSFEAVSIALLLVALFVTSGNCESCGENEVYDKCANDCYSTCKELNKPCPAVCGPGACRCRTGYVRQTNGGKCIRWDHC